VVDEELNLVSIETTNARKEKDWPVKDAKQLFHLKAGTKHGVLRPGCVSQRLHRYRQEKR